MSALKMNVLMFTEGTGYYYEIKVIFERFASIFNIQKKSMIKVDSEREITNRNNHRCPEVMESEQRTFGNIVESK